MGSVSDNTKLPVIDPTSDSRDLIGNNGLWYDVTNFLDKHPGGPAIRHFLGTDASALMEAWHSKNVLSRRVPVGRIPDGLLINSGDERFVRLSRWFTDHGWYTPSLSYYLKKGLICAGLLGASSCLGLSYKRATDSKAVLAAGGACMALFFQQCGFMMHDAMHTQVHASRRVSEIVGTIFGTVGVGISGMWWKDEHIVHHSVTNGYTENEGVGDPQMIEEVWAQNEKLIPFFEKSALGRLAVRVQGWTFVPLSFLFGRPAIVIDSFLKERRWYEWAAAGAHWGWMSVLLSYMPDWQARAIFYGVASIGEGVLHVQLVLSHYGKDFETIEDIRKIGWVKHQSHITLNIKNPTWLDWFHGGLNLHVEHHFFPRLPRHRLRMAQRKIMDLCEETGCEYDERPFMEAFIFTIKRFVEVSAEAVKRWA